ncbi:MAG: hypothetical protein M3P26_04335, partial [Gemmatimonadota bacterium]|nr:hypothetical protein [Gemmatimonadota bacterium]
MTSFVSRFSEALVLPAIVIATVSMADLAVGQGTQPAPTIRPSSLVLVTSESVDALRSDQLRMGVARGQSLLLRSASSLTLSMAPASSGWRVAAIAPQFLLVSNTKLPFSQNYGALWAGKGTSTRTLLGFRLESQRVRLIVAPEIVASSNRDWPLRLPIYVPHTPPLAAGRSSFSFPYYVGEFSIDQPLRFGDQPIRRFDPGQSSLLVSARSLQFGFSNENEWWGPGIRNAIVLSNNAPGFPHLVVRTAAPIDTRFGAVEMRWLVGGLGESRFFDSVSTNNTRSLASLGIALQTAWDPNLSVGFARSVYSTATGWGQVPWRWFDVFARTSHTAGASVRKDQLFSLFARWVFPADGLEVYTEWARTRLKPSLRELLLEPNDTQGYTLGLEWRGAEWHSGTFRIQGEVTQLEQSATWRDRPGPSWYASNRVIQGYTNRGQILGASIGPGASSQWLAVDYLRPSWRFGTY